jgi:predicted transcriptional regulator
MAYRETYMQEMDDLIKGMMVETLNPITVSELITKGNLRPGTVRNSLARLLKAGVVRRTWKDEACGHYVYSMPA